MSVENNNRYSALELDDEGNFVAPKPQKKPKEEKKEEAAAPAPAQEEKGRTRVNDRQRRGRGQGVRRGRGGYIGEGEKRDLDRRGAPGDERPRGRGRKGGVGLGRYGEDGPRGRNRPNKPEVDPTVEPTEAAPAEPAAEASTEATPETEAVSEVVPDVVVIEEEVDTSLTYDQFQAQLAAQQVEADKQRQLRQVEINEKQWKKVENVLDGKKKKTILTPAGQEVQVEEKNVEKPKVEKKKKAISLDEFVGTVPAPAPSSSPAASSERGARGGRGGRGGGRGGRGRGGRPGSSRGPAVPIDDKNAFPDLSAAAKKN